MPHTTQRIWNWQQEDWPKFRYDPSRLREREEQFLLHCGLFLGAQKHIHEGEATTLTVELMSREATKTSEIEGELLNRDSVQSSIRRKLGLSTETRRVSPAEAGISEMVVDLYRNFSTSLSHSRLFSWHRWITSGRSDLESIGKYRSHDDPMQVVSGRVDAPKIHFEAPPSRRVKREMDRFLIWFERSSPHGKAPLPALTRAGIAHLYLLSIHPFEDGNGRIGRAIAEKSLAQSLGSPPLLALSQVIQAKRKLYYDMLEKSNKRNQIDAWLDYFSNTILEAQDYTTQMVAFLIAKAKLYERLRDQLNERQSKVLERMFREGLSGFQGGLSAEKYIQISGTSRATATRDLTDLVEKNALTKSGVGKGTRYQLALVYS